MHKEIVALVPLLPWLAAVWIALGQIMHRAHDEAHDEAREKLTALVSVGLSLLALLIMLYLDLMAWLHGAQGQIPMGEWFSSGDFAVNASFTLDPLSLTMGTLVALLSLLTIRFSVNYLHRETGFQRFFMVMNLFGGAMLLLVLAGNAVMTFVGWELAGVSSYLLIGYVFDRPVATGNANRALITNRIGDGAFILGIFVAYTWVGDTEWHMINSLARESDAWGVGLLAISFVVAALVKSAVLPFSPWIARALEGPTPSSAIFYGALMVHAGVYLMIRLEPLLTKEPGVMVVIACLGLLTALYGWISGLVHSDVKASLMFSTTAQVGLMFFWCGLGWFELAAWHMGLHACWRAYHFLHAPSLMSMVSGAAAPAPRWLTKRPWLYTAAMQRFWLEHVGEALIARPTMDLAHDAQSFDERVVIPLVGLPSQANAVSSLEKHQEQLAGEMQLKAGRVGKGAGLAGKLMEGVASVLHWFEEQLVLKGGGEGLLRTLHRLGRHLIQIDTLLSQPRYLLLLFFIALVVIL